MAARDIDVADLATMADSARDLEFWRSFLPEQHLLLRMCVRWLNGNRQDAEDAVSRGALRALEFFRRHPGRVEKFRPWMLRLLYNLCVDIRKAQDRLTMLPRGDEDEDEPDLAGDSAALDHAVYSHELRQILVKEVASLPEWLHTVFCLRIVDEVEYAEICQQFRITPENARQRILQARRQLRARLVAFR